MEAPAENKEPRLSRKGGIRKKGKRKSRRIAKKSDK